ncbi:hypothetical protein PR048_028509 [Dryococelus australis]|uniref:Uncharacterized protein n=1 Tax=Dryococelus australis TaxID=614101 RepID=A0ABQ9GDJ2_9NEOP|nr:hypothetical protein PR048_028509 [Dryococelus australis]
MSFGHGEHSTRPTSTDPHQQTPSSCSSAASYNQFTSSSLTKEDRVTSLPRYKEYKTEKISAAECLPLQYVATTATADARVVNKRVTCAPVPRLTQEIRALMAQRDSAFSEYKKAKISKTFLIDTLHQRYKLARNKCTQQITNCKIKYYRKLDGKESPGAMLNNLRFMGAMYSRYTESKAMFTHDELNTTCNDEIKIKLICLIFLVILPTLTDIFKATITSRTFPA